MAAAAQAAAERAAEREQEELEAEGKLLMNAIRRAHIGSTGLGNEFAAEEEAERRKAEAEREEIAEAQKAQADAEQEIAYLERRLRELKGEDR
jgi:hypothetical protein